MNFEICYCEIFDLKTIWNKWICIKFNFSDSKPYLASLSPRVCLIFTNWKEKSNSAESFATKKFLWILNHMIDRFQIIEKGEWTFLRVKVWIFGDPLQQGLMVNGLRPISRQFTLTLTNWRSVQSFHWTPFLEHIRC